MDSGLLLTAAFRCKPPRRVVLGRVPLYRMCSSLSCRAEAAAGPRPRLLANGQPHCNLPTHPPRLGQALGLESAAQDLRAAMEPAPRPRAPPRKRKLWEVEVEVRRCSRLAGLEPKSLAEDKLFERIGIDRWVGCGGGLGGYAGDGWSPDLTHPLHGGHLASHAPELSVPPARGCTDPPQWQPSSLNQLGDPHPNLSPTLNPSFRQLGDPRPNSPPPHANRLQARCAVRAAAPPPHRS